LWSFELFPHILSLNTREKRAAKPRSREEMKRTKLVQPKNMETEGHLFEVSQQEEKTTTEEERLFK